MVDGDDAATDDAATDSAAAADPGFASLLEKLSQSYNFKDIPDDLLARYFVRDGQLWRLRRDLRRWCIFGAHNLTQAPPLSHIDLLVCRNVLIYFGSALQERILSRLRPDARDG